MTTPTPTVQDGERELLRLRSIAVLCAYTGRCVADLAEEEIDIMRNALDAVFATKSAELAALRAQVEGLRKLLSGAGHALRSYQHGNDSIGLAQGMAEKIEAALAPPQPVAKEK